MAWAIAESNPRIENRTREILNDFIRECDKCKVAKFIIQVIFTAICTGLNSPNLI